MLNRYPVDIRNRTHREELLRDARYYHLKGLEQRIIPHSISYNLALRKLEILIRLEDIRTSGVSFVADTCGDSASAGVSPASPVSSTPSTPGWVYYQRPYVDSEANSLIVQVCGEESTYLSVDCDSSGTSGSVLYARAQFHRQTLSRITRLFSIIADKMNLPVTQPLGLMLLERGAGVASLPISPRNTGVSDERVKVRIGPDADVTVDGKKRILNSDDDDDAAYGDSEMDVDLTPDRSTRSRSSRSQRRRTGQRDPSEGEEWIVTKAQWRLRVQPMPCAAAQSGRSGMEIILGAVKIEAYSHGRSRNVAREFLS